MNFPKILHPLSILLYLTWAQLNLLQVSSKSLSNSSEANQSVRQAIATSGSLQITQNETSLILINTRSVLLMALLIVINLIVVAGNILVILAVYATVKLRSVTNIFIVSLATADLLLGLFVLPYALTFQILDVWIFGEIWCRGWLVTDVWISTASILNLCAISIDRYVAVTRPVKYRSIMTPRKAKTIVAGVWIVSFLICFPPLLKQWNPFKESAVQLKQQSRFRRSIEADFEDDFVKFELNRDQNSSLGLKDDSEMLQNYLNNLREENCLTEPSQAIHFTRTGGQANCSTSKRFRHNVGPSLTENRASTYHLPSINLARLGLEPAGGRKVSELGPASRKGRETDDHSAIAKKPEKSIKIIDNNADKHSGLGQVGQAEATRAKLSEKSEKIKDNKQPDKLFGPIEVPSKGYIVFAANNWPARVRANCFRKFAPYEIIFKQLIGNYMKLLEHSKVAHDHLGESVFAVTISNLTDFFKRSEMLPDSTSASGSNTNPSIEKDYNFNAHTQRNNNETEFNQLKLAEIFKSLWQLEFDFNQLAPTILKIKSIQLSTGWPKLSLMSSGSELAAQICIGSACCDFPAKQIEFGELNGAAQLTKSVPLREVLISNEFSFKMNFAMLPSARLSELTNDHQLSDYCCYCYRCCHFTTEASTRACKEFKLFLFGCNKDELAPRKPCSNDPNFKDKNRDSKLKPEPAPEIEIWIWIETEPLGGSGRGNGSFICSPFIDSQNLDNNQSKRPSDPRWAHLENGFRLREFQFAFWTSIGGDKVLLMAAEKLQTPANNRRPESSSLGPLTSWLQAKIFNQKPGEGTTNEPPSLASEKSGPRYNNNNNDNNFAYAAWQIQLLWAIIKAPDKRPASFKLDRVCFVAGTKSDLKDRLSRAPRPLAGLAIHEFHAAPEAGPESRRRLRREAEGQRDERPARFASSLWGGAGSGPERRFAEQLNGPAPAPPASGAPGLAAAANERRSEGENKNENLAAPLALESANQGKEPIGGAKKLNCALFDDKPYVIYSALGSFYIPMLIMLFFYSRIYLVASRAHAAIQRGYMTTKWPSSSKLKQAANRFGSGANAMKNDNNNRQLLNRGAGLGAIQPGFDKGPASLTDFEAARGIDEANLQNRVTLRIHRKEKGSANSGGQSRQQQQASAGQMAANQIENSKALVKLARRRRQKLRPTIAVEPKSGSPVSLLALSSEGEKTWRPADERPPVEFAKCTSAKRAEENRVEQVPTVAEVDQLRGQEADGTSQEKSGQQHCQGAARHLKHRRRRHQHHTYDCHGHHELCRDLKRNANEARAERRHHYHRCPSSPALLASGPANAGRHLGSCASCGAKLEHGSRRDASQVRSLASSSCSGPPVFAPKTTSSGSTATSTLEEVSPVNSVQITISQCDDEGLNLNSNNNTRTPPGSSLDGRDFEANQIFVEITPPQNHPKFTETSTTPTSGATGAALGQCRLSANNKSERSQSVDVSTDAVGESFLSQSGGITGKDNKIIEIGGLALTGSQVSSFSRVDRSHSCGPAPIIVVNWNPVSQTSETQIKSAFDGHGAGLVKSSPNLLVGQQQTVLAGQNLKTIVGRKQQQQQTSERPSLNGSQCSGLSIMASIPNQVRKQSMMLLTTLTTRSSQTLRRLSMVASHPVGTILSKSKLASGHGQSSSDLGERQAKKLKVKQRSKRKSCSGEPDSNEGTGGGSSKKTLDDYLMAVAGIDSSTDDSDYIDDDSLDITDEEDEPELVAMASRASIAAFRSEDPEAGLPANRSISEENERLLTPMPISLDNQAQVKKALASGANYLARSNQAAEAEENNLSDSRSEVPESKTELFFKPSSGLRRQGGYYERATSRSGSTQISSDEQLNHARSSKSIFVMTTNLMNKSLVNGRLMTVSNEVGKAESNVVAIPSSNDNSMKVSTQLGPANNSNVQVKRYRRRQTSRWHAKRLHAETKAAKTVAIIVGGFVFCWLPFFTVYLSRAIICQSPDCVPQTILSLFIWLGYLNSAINPVIYGLFSADFRHAFKNIVCRCRFRSTDDTRVVSVLVDSIIKSIM